MLKDLVTMSNKYGKDPELVLAGGGNTSLKKDGILYIKASGTQLATITQDGFVAMDCAKIDETFNKQYSSSDDEREAQVLVDMAAAKLPGQENLRPSVEAALHRIINYKLVLHVHPAAVNGITCGQKGKEFADRVFGDDYIWVPITRPGYILSVLCKNKLEEFKEKKGYDCKLLLLQNHGIFFGADSLEEMDAFVPEVMGKINEGIGERYDFSPVEYKEDKAAALAKKIEEITGKSDIKFIINKTVSELITPEGYKAIEKPFTPDHIVYCKAYFLFTDENEFENNYKDFCDKNGYSPKVIIFKNFGVFAVGDNAKELITIENLFLDAVKIAVYARSFGGPLPMTDELIDFITNWEIESYRKKVAQ